MCHLVFRGNIKWPIMRKLILKEIVTLIYGALGTIISLSFFIGVVVAIQTALNIKSPFIPKYLVGFATRQAIILEFSPMLISIIMAGKIGSYITSSIGSMKATEQIDALKLMGVNPLKYLVFPKIIALHFYPFVIAISMYVGVVGGWLAAVGGGHSTNNQFIEGLLINFQPFHVLYAFVKTYIFGLILSTVPAYHGYYMKGGALELGKATTKSFEWTVIIMIFIDYFLTHIMLG